MSAQSCHNKFVYERHHFVPRHPLTVHQPKIGEVMTWHPEDCTVGQIDVHIEAGTHIQTTTWGNFMISSEKVTVMKVKAKAQLDAAATGVPVSASTAVAFSFEDNNQQVIKADGCVCKAWDASSIVLKVALTRLFQENKDLPHGNYLVVLSVITAGQATIFEGQKDQIVISSEVKAESLFIPASLAASVEYEKKLEIEMTASPISGKVVGIQIWPFSVSWLGKIKLGEQAQGNEEEASQNASNDVAIKELEHVKIDGEKPVNLALAELFRSS